MYVQCTYTYYSILAYKLIYLIIILYAYICIHYIYIIKHIIHRIHFILKHTLNILYIYIYIGISNNKAY